MPVLDREGDVYVLNLGEGENRFNPQWIGAVNSLLDEVEASPSPRALVVTASGKIWSNGLDLEWLAANTSELNPFLVEVHGLLARVLELGVPNIAALQGHTFAGGAMLALAFDRRIMRADRGYFCLPEVDINIPFTPGMSSLIQARLGKQPAHEAMTTGRRYGGADALDSGIVQATAELDQLLPLAIEAVSGLATKDGGTLKTIKQRMYRTTLDCLRDVEANSISVPGL